MEVRWEGAPPVERIRAAVSSRLSGVSVVAAHDLTGSNEVLVSAELPAEGDLTALRQIIDQALSTVNTRYSIRSFEVIGPQIGADLRRQALMATAGASGGMLLYLAWRFRMVYGVAAVIAMAHGAGQGSLAENFLRQPRCIRSAGTYDCDGGGAGRRGRRGNGIGGARHSP